MRRALAALARFVVCLGAVLGCAPGAQTGTTLTLSASSVGREGALLSAQLARFHAEHPHVRVVLEETPDAADQRHQLYVQWLNAASTRPDVLQLDVIWTPEFAAAGWLLPLTALEPAPGEFLNATLEANRYQGRLWALPWFVDVGMLYYRTDLLSKPPASLRELEQLATRRARAAELDYGLVWQNARYEGLVTTFIEVLGGFGGTLMSPTGKLTLDTPEARRALAFMRDLLDQGAVPRQVLGWQEEQTRFAFQNGRALFMRNWPYAHRLLESQDSSVRGRFGVMPMPAAATGTPTAALGGAQLAINRHSEHPEAALALVRFLTAPEQMRERATLLGQLPPRPALFDDPELEHAFGVPPQRLLDIVRSAKPRPPHPLYSELSSILQVELHRALSGQKASTRALADAQQRGEALLTESGFASGAPPKQERAPTWLGLPVLGLLVLASLVFAWRWLARRTGSGSTHSQGDAGEAASAWWMLTPALLVLTAVALLPLCATLWQSLFPLDLRLPWKDARGPSLENYRLLLSEPHFWGALWRTLFFVATSVSLELVLGLGLALLLRGQGLAPGLSRPLTLLPWAVPTVVAGLVFRFLFEGPESFANVAVYATGLADSPIEWLTREGPAWVPVILADVWKTTPFVALLLLAALAGIDGRLYEAAAVDGAYRVRQFIHVTLPQLRPALLVVLLFRSLDALRVFDLIYVLTQGGPGTATEPLALYTFTTLFSHLRFGQGAALSVLIAALAGLIALLFLAVIGMERKR